MSRGPLDPTPERPLAIRLGWPHLLVAVAVVGFAVGKLIGGGSTDPRGEIRAELFVVDLQQDRGFELSPRFSAPYDGTERSARLVHYPVYHGALSPDRVAALVNAGRAQALEWRLGAGWKQRVSRQARSIDESLWEVTLALHDEERAAIAKLKTRGTDTWRWRHDAADADARQTELRAKVNPLFRDRQATVSSVSRAGEITHYVIRRKDFPVYWEYMDQQMELLRERERRRGEAVERLFDEHGMEIFAPREQASRQGK